MIARCIANKGADLPSPSRDALYGEETEYALETGNDYIVLGIGLFATVVVVLIWDETSLPSWLPIGLFDLSTQRLPAHWEFAVFDGQAASGGDSANRWLARLGYPRLVHDDAHSDALIERDPAELQFCFRELLARQENQPPIFEGD